MTGLLSGVGVGPGDPELMTLKAARIIREADVVCYLVNRQGHSIAKEIANAHLHSEQICLPLGVPMSRDREAANLVYDKAAGEIKQHLAENKKVAVLCEGDPFFYGSFIYLFERLQSSAHIQIIPGIMSINAASAATLSPLCRLDESYVIVTSQMSDSELRTIFQTQQNIAILKAGPHRIRLLKLLNECRRQQDACYIERASTHDQLIVMDVSKLPDENGPYFSLFLVSGKANND